MTQEDAGGLQEASKRPPGSLRQALESRSKQAYNATLGRAKDRLAAAAKRAGLSLAHYGVSKSLPQSPEHGCLKRQ